VESLQTSGKNGTKIVTTWFFFFGFSSFEKIVPHEFPHMQRGTIKDILTWFVPLTSSSQTLVLSVQ